MQIDFLDGSVESFNSLRYADLRYANLRYTDLQGVDLQGVDLRYASLRHADLRDTDLQDASLRYASLRYTSLQGTNLGGADLRDTNLQDANLRGAKIKGVKWPSPPMVLLAFWGRLSDNLTQLLMKYDMHNHPELEKFKIWKDTGECPNVQLLSAYELMQMLLKECCVG